jgi:acetyl-CoA carboxylase carboxyl transferase subunit beta
MSVLDWFAKNNNFGIKPKEKVQKLDIPGNLWVKCYGCGGILYSKDLEKNQKVCPSCGYHFKLGAYERIEMVFDQDSFVEFDQNISPKDTLKFVDLKSYQDRIEEAQKKSKLKDAVVCGEAKLENKPLITSVMDFSFMGGSMGSVVGEKITRAVEKAIELKLPYVVFTTSGGARMQEGILSLMQMAKTSAALELLAEAKLPYIVVLTDPTTGGTTASFAMLGDIHIAEKGALVAFAGPRVIEQTIRQKLPKGFQRAEYLAEHGMVDIVLERAELRPTLIRILEILRS